MQIGFDPSQNGQVTFAALPIGAGFVFEGNLFVKQSNATSANAMQLNVTPLVPGTLQTSHSVYPVQLVVDQVITS